MKKFLVKKINDLFRPASTMDLDVYEVLEALGDGVVRKSWLYELLSEIKNINLSIDEKLKSGEGLPALDLAHLSGRRRALQFVFEAALSAKREVQRSRGHNPATPGELDLDSVTLRPGIG